MKMVRHQTETKQTHRVMRISFVQQFEKRPVVAVLVENRITTVTTIQDVVANVTNRSSGSARHFQTLPNTTQLANK